MATSDTPDATHDPALEDEFRFLAADAARVAQLGGDLGGSAPRALRVCAPSLDGRSIAAIKFTSHLAPDRVPRLVALHGAGLNAHSFDPMLIALGEPALAVDLPGHGRSSWREDADYGPATLATDLAPALTQLAPGPHVLLGHSLGALAAVMLAAAAPDRVTQLILVDMTPGVRPGRDAGSVTEFIQGQRSFESVDEMVERAIAFGIGSDRAALTRGVSLNTRHRPDGRLEWTHHFAHLTGLTKSPDDNAFAPLWDVLKELPVPVSLVRAESGLVTGELESEWRTRLPDSRVVSLAGPHNLHEACPVELARAVRELLA
ncbi:alpha/beta fold hydrolase [Leucobacter sp. HY1908]